LGVGKTEEPPGPGALEAHLGGDDAEIALVALKRAPPMTVRVGRRTKLEGRH